MAPVRDVFNLIVRPEFRGYSTTRMLASEINGLTADLEDSADASDLIATALDDMTVRVIVPERERANASAFVATILTKRFSPSLMDLPAQVIVNERTGNILLTGDVEISAVTIGNDKLVVTTVSSASGGPAPVGAGGVGGAVVEHRNLTEFGTAATNADRARMEDLLQAFTRLNIPVREQINILSQIHQSGRLHARFVVQ
jgi:flagellar P-ring protein precursor FlgI